MALLISNDVVLPFRFLRPVIANDMFNSILLTLPQSFDLWMIAVVNELLLPHKRYGMFLRAKPSGLRTPPRNSDSSSNLLWVHPYSVHIRKNTSSRRGKKIKPERKKGGQCTC